LQDRDDLRQRPFAPARNETSFLTMVLWWVVLGAVGFGIAHWLEQRKLAARTVQQAKNRVPAQPVHATELPSTPAPPPEQPPAPVRPPRIAPVIPPPPDVVRREEAPLASGTIYLCKAYNGGTFWAQAHCNQHQALIDSMVSVPAGLPFEQKVEIAQRQRQATAQLVDPSPQVRSVAPAVAGNQGECTALDARVAQLDAMAREPHTAQMQDWIRGERKKARDRQFELRC
jgi:hypothetical protein